MLRWEKPGAALPGWPSFATKGDAAEVELYGTCTVDLAETAKQITSLPDQEAGATKLNCPGVSADVTVTVKSSNSTGIVAGDGCAIGYRGTEEDNVLAGKQTVQQAILIFRGKLCRIPGKPGN